MQLYQATGLHFGFPECCITSFREGVFKIHKSQYKELMPKTGVRNQGFIPCLNHLEQLASGEISKEELLKHRLCKTSFPNGHLCTCPEKLKRTSLKSPNNGTSQKYKNNYTEP